MELLFGPLFILGLGLLFLIGFFTDERRFFRAIDISLLFFRDRMDSSVIKSANKASFIFCLVIAMLAFANSVASLIYQNFFNLGLVYVVVAAITVWPFRAWIMYNNNKKKKRRF